MLETRKYQDDFVDMTLRLVGEFPQLPPGSVIRCATRCRRALRAEGLSGVGLVTAAEHMTRVRLRQRLHSRAA